MVLYSRLLFSSFTHENDNSSDILCVRDLEVSINVPEGVFSGRSPLRSSPAHLAIPLLGAALTHWFTPPVSSFA